MILMTGAKTFERIRKIFKARLKSDRGDGTLIMFIVSVPLFVILLGFCINTNNSVTAKTEFDTMAQTSAETSIKTLKADGTLGQKSVEKFIDEYRSQFKNSHGIVSSEQCSTAEVDGKKVKLPYYKVVLDSGRGKGVKHASSTWVVEGNGSVDDKTSALRGKKFKTLTAEVYTATPNIFSSFGVPSCQVHKSSVSAIAFGSRKDVS